MLQEKEVTIEHAHGPVLPIAEVHIGAPGAHSLSVRAKVAMTKSAMQVNYVSG